MTDISEQAGDTNALHARGHPPRRDAFGGGRLGYRERVLLGRAVHKPQAVSRTRG